jgi:hypothetical protein
MASSDYLQPSAQTSASEVLKVVILELRELRSRYREVTGRIRNLRIAVDALRSLGTEPAHIASGHRQSSTLPEQDWTASSRNGAGDASRATSAVRARSVIRRQNPDLRRACRIALMEVMGAVTDAEIYARIVRRGSFCFVRADSATRAIAEELDAMVEQGELRLVNDPSKRLWEQIRSEHDQEDTARS